MLRINYTDDGKGISPGSPATAGNGPSVGNGPSAGVASSAGIGLQNIRERVGMLKGDFQLHNAYPQGYSIDISIPLL